jgi:hypothetical protein
LRIEPIHRRRGLLHAELMGVQVGALPYLWPRDIKRVALVTRQRLDAAA